MHMVSIQTPHSIVSWVWDFDFLQSTLLHSSRASLWLHEQHSQPTSHRWVRQEGSRLYVGGSAPTACLAGANSSSPAPPGMNIPSLLSVAMACCSTTSLVSFIFHFISGIWRFYCLSFKLGSGFILIVPFYAAFLCIFKRRRACLLQLRLSYAGNFHLFCLQSQSSSFQPTSHSCPS